MEISETLLSTPLTQLSVKDFDTLLEAYRENSKFMKEQLFDEEVWLSGYKSLAKFLNCSVPTVCRIVKSGKLDAATRKVGGTYWFNKSMLVHLLKLKNISD